MMFANSVDSDAKLKRSNLGVDPNKTHSLMSDPTYTMHLYTINLS